MKKLFMLIGVIAFLLGLLWIGQGLGYINWPAGTQMINDQKWAMYGGVLAVVGLIIMFFSRAR